jgi:hypothetical protein
MRQENHAEVGRRQPVRGQAGLDGGERAGWAWVDQRRLIARQQIDADHMRAAEVPCVDQAHIVRQGH